MDILISVVHGTNLFLQHIKVVDDDTNKEVESKEGADDDEGDEVPICVEIGLTRWLLINLKRRRKF